MNMFNALRSGLRQFWQLIKESRKQVMHQCRVIEIEQDKHENYIITVQLTNKSQIFKMKPEEILADDSLTDCFSQRDVRTLTYLGYLGINAPKYKILAKRLSEKDNRFVFAIKERGKDQPIVKTADELSQDDDIISSLNQKDAHMIGYTSAAEQNALEKAELKKLLNNDN
jgi:hypothetical protein